MERDRFIAATREAVAMASLPPAPADSPGLRVPELPDVDLAELFAEKVVAIDGQVHRAVDPVETIAAICLVNGASQYMSWDPGHLPVPDLLDRLEDHGLTRVAHVVPADPAGRLEHQGAYTTLVVGITGAEAGFAESGSVVVRSGPGRPRMASLIPSIHVVLLEEGRIHRSLPHWAGAHGYVGDEASNLVFISGPSRTGDIEQQLNLGVHGPREVHVIMI